MCIKYIVFVFNNLFLIDAHKDFFQGRNVLNTGYKDWIHVQLLYLRRKPPTISVRLDFLKCVKIFIFFKTLYT